MRDRFESEWDERLVHGRGPSQPAGSVDFVSDIRVLWQAVTSRILLVAGCVAGAVLVTIAYIWMTPPIYASTAEVLIDPRRQDVFQQEIVPSGMGQSSLGADTFLLDSQVEMIWSQSILRQVIRDLDLTSNRELAEGGGTGGFLVSLAKLILRGPQVSRPELESPEDEVLRTLRDQLSVGRKGNTYVIDITMEMKDPVAATAVANAIAETYIEELDVFRLDKINEVEDRLGGRLGELRAATLDAQRRAEDYRSDNGLLSTQQLPVIEQQLRDLNQELTRVSAEALAARARYDEVSRLRGSSIDVILAAGSVNSNLLDSLLQQYAIESSREASLLSSLLPGHPSVRAARDAQESLRAEIKREIDRLVRRYQAQFDVATTNEAELRQRVDELKQLTAENNQASVTLRDLEREAEANARLFEQFLVRSKDAREQVNLPTNTARIISPAYPGIKPIWPSEILLLAAALFAGTLAGIALALGMHLFGASPPGARAPTR